MGKGRLINGSINHFKFCDRFGGLSFCKKMTGCAGNAVSLFDMLLYMLIVGAHTAVDNLQSTLVVCRHEFVLHAIDLNYQKHCLNAGILDILIRELLVTACAE